VVFDIGGVARDNEHIHAAAVRQVQARLGYCSTEPLVADFELKLERDGEWKRFESVARRRLGPRGPDRKDKALAEEDFSLVMSVLFPDRYTDPMAWYTSRGGTHSRSESPEEAVAAIRDMLGSAAGRHALLRGRRGLAVRAVQQGPGGSPARVRDRAGRRPAGKVWLLALGQQKLDEGADDSFLVWAKDRFPPKLRVHLATTNIRDVVHKRLLHKRTAEAQLLRACSTSIARPQALRLRLRRVTPDEFVEVYPMLPGHIDLILQITSALRTRSTVPGRRPGHPRPACSSWASCSASQRLADGPSARSVTLDQIYEVQHTALDSDVQASMARVLSQCADDPSA
jgi:hypothetical protein